MTDVFNRSSVSDLSDFNGEQDRWRREIDFAEKLSREYREQCENIDKRYRDKRKEVDSDERKFNALWSIIQTLMPAAYAKEPTPVVARRFRSKDPVARQASTILERALIYSQDEWRWGRTWRSVVQDYLLFARGTAWARYSVEFENERPVQRLEWDRVHVADFLTDGARDWANVSWVGRRLYMTRPELIERFGPDIGERVTLDYVPEISSGKKIEGPDDLFKKALVWEIWDKPSKTAIWCAPSWDEDAPLDVKPDPLKLRNFFPTPEPLFGTLGNQSLIPIPDFHEYQDQARELDELTQRISLIVSAVRLAGLYAGKEAGVQALLDSTATNVMIPVDSWAAFAQAGGLKGAVSWLPLDQVAVILGALFQARAAKKAELDEITGIADIVRGASSGPAKTATEQSIKSQYASLRIRDRQQEVQRYIRDGMQIAGEIISEHFTPDNLAMMSDMKIEPRMMDQKTGQLIPGGPVGQAIELLKNDAQRSVRVDIETDSTIAADEEADKRSRVEFLTAIGTVLEKGLPLVMQVPAAAPLIGETLGFLARGFRAGNSLEEAIDQFSQQIAQQAAQKPPQPDPKMIEAQNRAQIAQRESQQRMAQKQQEGVVDLAIKRQEVAGNMQLKQQEQRGDFVLRTAEQQQEAALNANQQQLDHAAEQARIAADAARPEIVVA